MEFTRELADKREEKEALDDSGMDSKKGKHHGVENDEMNLVLVLVFAGDTRGGGESSPEL